MTRTKVYVLERINVQEIGKEGMGELKRNYTLFDSPKLFYLPSIPLVLGGNIVYKDESMEEKIERKERGIGEVVERVEIRSCSAHPAIIEAVKKRIEANDYDREIKTKKEWLSHVQDQGDFMNKSKDQLNKTILALFENEEGVIKEEEEEKRKELEEKLRHVVHK